MAKKEIDFIIKVNNKELDLSKTSMQKFDVEIKKAKTDLKTLETQFGKNSIQYKGAVKDINAAEKAWKTAQKAAGSMNDQIEKNTAQTKTYSQQIRIEQKALIDIGNQYGKSSQQYADQAAKVKALREEQEDLQRSTLKLDDALGNLPGILGTVGQSMQQFDNIAGSAKGALNTLGLGFKTLDQTLKTTLIGFVVGLFATLVAAINSAMKSSKPLQDAMAALSGAFDGIMEAMKPVADFLIGVMTAGIKIAAAAIGLLGKGIAMLTGQMDEFNSASRRKELSLALQRTIDTNKRIIENYSATLSELSKKQLDVITSMSEKMKQINEDETKNEKQKEAEIQKILRDAFDQKKILEKERENYLKQKALDEKKVQDEAANASITNERVRAEKALQIQRQYDKETLKLEKSTLDLRIELLDNRLEQIKKNGDDTFGVTKKILEESRDLYIEDKKNLEDEINNIDKTAKSQLTTNSKEYTREDKALINERLLATEEANIELIKDEFRRNVETAKLAKERLLETQRLEIESNNLAGATTKKLKEKQAAEIKAADEAIRKAKLQEDTYLIQLEIDKNNKLATEAGVGTKEYFDARKKVIEDEYQKEFFLADDNRGMEEAATLKHYQALKDLTQEKLQSDLALISKQYDATYENTQMFFDRQRDLIDKQYEIDQETYKNNEKMLLAIKEDYIKKREMVDVAALQWSSDYFTRRAETEKKAYGEMYKDLRFAEDMAFEARKKAAKGNAVELELIEREHQANMRKILDDEIKDYGYVASQILDSLSNLTNAIASTYDEEAKTSEAAFNKRKDLQLATAYMSAASGVIQILTQPSTLPSPFDWIVKGINAAALGIATYAQIDNIKNTKFGGTSSSATGGTQYADASFRGYADGGMIEGPRHAQGGTLIEAEGGEAIMTRNAVASFGPLLSMLNQAGGGTSFNVGQQKSYDNPVSVNGKTQGEPMIIKTYVVSNELTTAQERQSRLKELSVL